ncbi:hypothetical protein BO86DRAFT_425754 [Aspergillus japonicus CBS 114.51]|uniref:Uncharacterized protein n=1 Tax=Aspergillus japonicus CBS 114.51 TaxID=1448312 RepID=A0A8T8WJU3_ASPJA|nr:hypothetical protein BO86DRAFT_425754 [Aspergillus japonicus CBS 114.51]RAH76095.1 hypothetical protein BO86DRAFT_425754 [Aspergillus japonicus CBS 114.51]
MKVHFKLLLSFIVLNLLSTLVAAGRENWLPRARNKKHSIFPRQSTTPTGVTLTSAAPFIVGQNNYGTSVSLQVSGSNLIVNYPLTKDFKYNEVHVWIGTGTPPNNPGSYPYIYMLDNNNYNNYNPSCNYYDNKSPCYNNHYNPTCNYNHTASVYYHHNHTASVYYHHNHTASIHYHHDYRASIHNYDGASVHHYYHRASIHNNH